MPTDAEDSGGGGHGGKEGRQGEDVALRWKVICRVNRVERVREMGSRAERRIREEERGRDRAGPSDGAIKDLTAEKICTRWLWKNERDKCTVVVRRGALWSLDARARRSNGFGCSREREEGGGRLGSHACAEWTVDRSN